MDSRPDPPNAPEDLYAAPRVVEGLGECFFYHTVDVPGHGHAAGPWDLRGGVDAYLGGVDLRGKRVLDVGTASGFLCFEMERRGAEVVAYDLSEQQDWDSVPYAGHEHERFVCERRHHIRLLNNSFWLCHRAFGSRARMAHGTVYEVPAAIGPVDVATVGCLLLHLRDPFLALERVLRLVRETVILVDFLEMADGGPAPARVPLWRRALRRLKRSLGWPVGVRPPAHQPAMVFLPDAQECMPKETWWRLSPEVLRRFIGVLGFRDSTVTYHCQKFDGRLARLFTVVGRRTDGAPVACGQTAA
jgi:SAM-dependent methyltransferase